MVDYIPRSEAINELRHRCNPCGEGIEAINAIPAADVAPVVHGRWIYEEETLFTLSGYRCSVCRWPRWLSPDVPEAFRYCPNYGAKMDGGDGDAVD